MMGTVKYHLVQYMACLFRREVKNVGVIVESGGQYRARFIGEDDNGKLDLRRARFTDYPETYRLWVDFYRDQLKGPSPDMAYLINHRKDGNYNVIVGGEVTGMKCRTLKTACDDLFGRLVSHKMSHPIGEIIWR